MNSENNPVQITIHTPKSGQSESKTTPFLYQKSEMKARMKLQEKQIQLKMKHEIKS